MDDSSHKMTTLRTKRLKRMRQHGGGEDSELKKSQSQSNFVAAQRQRYFLLRIFTTMTQEIKSLQVEQIGY